MSKIAILKDDYSFDFDNGWLYKGEEKITEIKGREADLLRCLCEAPNQYLSFDKISDMVAEMDYAAGKGTRVNGGDFTFFSRETIRPWKANLLNKHEIFRDTNVIDTVRGKGYVYYGQPIIDKDDSYNNQIGDGLEMLMVDFINTTDLSTETNISFMTDDERLTRILQLANQLKGQITSESDISLVLRDMIDDRVSKYVECKEACLCIRDCGEYLGQNTLNDEVISNVHFIACFESYAQKQGYIIDKNICLCNKNDFINLFVAVLQSPEGTKEFLDSIFYGPDRIIIYMQEGKERLFKTFYKFRGDHL